MSRLVSSLEVGWATVNHFEKPRNLEVGLESLTLGQAPSQKAEVLNWAEAVTVVRVGL